MSTDPHNPAPRAVRTPPHDALVVGAGPAGLTLAAELVARGLDVAILSPQWPPPWPNTYGLWRDELEGLRDAAVLQCVSHEWARPAVLTQHRRFVLERPYARVDNTRLRGLLLERCAPARQIEGAARSLARLDGATGVVLESGGEVWAQVVIDATGHRPALVRRHEPAREGVQTAYGVEVLLDEDPIAPEHMVLMDFSTPAPSTLASPEDAALFDPQAPSFLYAMRLGPGRYFLEETALVARPPMPIGALRDRLHARMAARRARWEIVAEEERCVIPMGLPLPLLDQRVLGFGGAASMVHPATGYQLARVLRWAPGFADAIQRAIEEEPDADRRSARLWQALWTPERVRRRQLFCYGMEVLLTFDSARTQRFFEAFFEQPPVSWQGYLSGELSSGALAGVMLRLFGTAPMGLRVELARSVFGPSREHLLRALTARGWR